jgi:hypothetical protein
MNIPRHKAALRAIGELLSLQLPLIGAAVAEDTPIPAPTPLINKVRAATARFIDINQAFHAGFVTGTPCVSGPDTGAMGVHLVMGSRIGSLVLDPTEPQALIYEPKADGTMRLVGVEFIVLESVWVLHNPNGGVPALDGNLMNFVAAPNRFGLPAFYELHVWAWQNNPKGSYADWNTQVTCVNQPLS